jgi:hypothetical protein
MRYDGLVNKIKKAVAIAGIGLAALTFSGKQEARAAPLPNFTLNIYATNTNTNQLVTDSIFNQNETYRIDFGLSPSRSLLNAHTFTASDGGISLHFSNLSSDVTIGSWKVPPSSIDALYGLDSSMYNSFIVSSDGQSILDLNMMRDMPSGSLNMIKNQTYILASLYLTVNQSSGTMDIKNQSDGFTEIQWAKKSASWQAYDKQFSFKPIVPEPEFYGAIMTGIALFLFYSRKLRKQ